MRETCVSERLLCVWGQGSYDLYAVGDGGVFLTTRDGGQSWHKRSAGTSDDIEDVTICGDGTLIAAGGAGKVFFSDDGGITWSSQSCGAR